MTELIERYCDFCEIDGQGNHAPRCPVALEAELKAKDERIAELEGEERTRRAAHARIVDDMANDIVRERAGNKALALRLGVVQEELAAEERGGQILREATEKAEARLSTCLRLLGELHATVLGESPQLLNEDSGGNGRLAIDIEDMLTTAVEGQETCRNCGKPVSAATTVAIKDGKPICVECFYVPIIGFDMASGPDKVFYRCTNCKGIFDAPLAHECRVVEELEPDRSITQGPQCPDCSPLHRVHKPECGYNDSWSDEARAVEKQCLNECNAYVDGAVKCRLRKGHDGRHQAGYRVWGATSGGGPSE